MSNTLGKCFTVTSFGESHGQVVGVVIDGCPAGLNLTTEDIISELERRKPRGISSTPRRESDNVKIVSGVHKNYTTGAPVTLMIENANIDSSTYEEIASTPRPGHADYTARIKYGGFSDNRGGGRFSGRITAGFVMAGAVAKKLLKCFNIEVLAHTVEIGNVPAAKKTIEEIRSVAKQNELYCADESAISRMLAEVNKAKKQGDSLGGIVEIIATGLPVGLGEPVFDTLDGELAKAYFAVPAVKGVEFGAGFLASKLKGSQNNDPLVIKNNEITSISNNAGGISGGLSNGLPVVARVAIKPTPSISIAQDSVNLNTLQPVRLEIKGRHDVCIVPRVVVVLETMTAITITDLALRAHLISGVIK